MTKANRLAEIAWLCWLCYDPSYITGYYTTAPYTCMWDHSCLLLFNGMSPGVKDPCFCKRNSENLLRERKNDPRQNMRLLLGR